MADRPADFTTEIEVTPEMIEAGERAYYDFDKRFEMPSNLVERVFLAMFAASPLVPRG